MLRRVLDFGYSFGWSEMWPGGDFLKLLNFLKFTVKFGVDISVHICGLC